jgi:predicted PurR-regulated permease PerM
MSFPDRRTSSILLTILLFMVAVGVVYVARRVIIVFSFSILFAYLINPIVGILQRHSLLFRNLRGAHVFEAYLATLSWPPCCPTVYSLIFAKTRASSLVRRNRQQPGN